MLKDGIKVVDPRTRNEWRKWLSTNHVREKKAWLIIYHKKSESFGLSVEEAVEEALCFGWIDSKANKRDAESFYISFSKRNPKSAWSKINKERVRKLVRQKMMTPAGMEMIKLAKRTGTWDALTKIDNLEIPDDLRNELRRNRTALKHFEAFPPSTRKMILAWIMSAKREETRLRRVNQTVQLAAKNIRANQYVPKNEKA
jgi:uncharacterized protein YdeI (YjbR/CyaY-like superfamily)